MKALLLSAGLGTRLRPYTHTIPKPCMPFFGVPLAYYSLYLLGQTSCSDVVVNLHHLPEKVKALFEKFPAGHFSFQYSLEKEKPMGSGGALYYAKDLLSGSDSFFAINSDEVFIPSGRDILSRLQAHHLKTQSMATLLVTDHPDLGKTLKPVWVDQNGTVVAFGKQPDQPGLRPVHYTGCKIFSKDILPLLPEGESNIFYDTVMLAIHEGATINTLHDTCRWWETGEFGSFLKATGDAIEIAAADPRANHFRDVQEFLGLDFDYQFQTAGKKVAIHRSTPSSGVATAGTVFIDRNAQLGLNISVRDAIINSGANIKKSISGTLEFAP